MCLALPSHRSRGDNAKGKYADELRGLIRDYNNDPHPPVIGYSDGHAEVANGCMKIGVGYVITIHGKPVAASSRAIGHKASIYDAEMLAIAQCLTKTARIASANNATNIRIYSDNSAAIQTFWDLKRHAAQFAPVIFRRAPDPFLDGHPERRVHIAWIPGHKGFKGNEMADKLAKGGANVPPTPIFNRTVT
ncbi:ribonuclease HI, partial [Rhizoctonia solani AG-3 Rhs1AP]